MYRLIQPALVLLFALPFTASAQDCQLIRGKDQFSQDPKLSTGFIRYSSASLSIDATGKEIDFLFTAGNGSADKCFDDESTATFLFEGGKVKTNYKNSGAMNCKGYFQMNFKNGPATPFALQRLQTKKVLSITLTGSNKSVTVITLSPEQQEQFQKMMACVITEAKTLVK